MYICSGLTVACALSKKTNHTLLSPLGRRILPLSSRADRNLNGFSKSFYPYIRMGVCKWLNSSLCELG